MWNLDNFSQKQFFLHTHTLISANPTSIIASYNRHSISLADYNRELINF